MEAAKQMVWHRDPPPPPPRRRARQLHLCREGWYIVGEPELIPVKGCNFAFDLRVRIRREMNGTVAGESPFS